MKALQEAIEYLRLYAIDLRLNHSADEEANKVEQLIKELESMMQLPAPQRTGPGRLSGTEVPGKPGLYYL